MLWGVNSAKREVYYSELYLKHPGAAAGLVWNPAVTMTGCSMLLAMFLALPFALKWPKQSCWIKDTSLGKVMPTDVCLASFIHPKHARCCNLAFRVLQQ